MQGLMLIDRAMLHHHIVGIQHPQRFAAWCWMLSQARWKDGRFDVMGKTIDVERGQFVTTLNRMSEETGMTVKQVRTFISRLEREKMCTKKGIVSGTGKGIGATVITICKYETYQDFENYRAQVQAHQVASEGHVKGKQKNTRSKPDETPEDLFGSFESPPKKPARRAVQLPEGWVPNDKNIEHALSKNLTHQEIEHEADQFRNHHHAKGSTYKDWDAAWRTWVGNARKFSANRNMARNSAPGGHGRGGSLASAYARRYYDGQV